MEACLEDSGMTVRPRFLDVFRALNDAEARYLVMGGLACILHGYVRATTDIDILIPRSRQDAERVLEALSHTGYGFAREWTADQVLAKPITIIGDDPAVDIFLVAMTVEYDQAVQRSSVVDIEGVPIPLMGLDDLIATKRTGRPLDAEDIEVLEKIRRLRGK
jgi:hypothetical protein